MKFVIVALNLWLEHQVPSDFSLPKLEERETSTMSGVS